MTTGSGYEPYVGLRPYRMDDADRFFGRSMESRDVRTLVFASRLTVVYGHSGVGKTSLIEAGVLPGIDEGEAQVLPVGRLPRATPFAAPPPGGGNPFVGAVLGAWSGSEVGGDQAGGADMTLKDFLLRRVSVAENRYGEPLPLVVVIDQFEEAFGDLSPWAGPREDLLRQIADATAAVDRLRLVLSMKEDLVGQMLLHEVRLAGGSRGTRYRVAPLDRDAALEAVTQPLQPTGRTFAEGVDEELVDRLCTITLNNAAGEQLTVRTATVEPVYLQVACSGLWDALPPDVDTITAHHLGEHG